MKPMPFKQWTMEAAERFHVHANTISNYIRDGRLNVLMRKDGPRRVYILSPLPESLPVKPRRSDGEKRLLLAARLGISASAARGRFYRNQIPAEVLKEVNLA